LPLAGVTGCARCCAARLERTYKYYTPNKLSLKKKNNTEHSASDALRDYKRNDMDADKIEEVENRLSYLKSLRKSCALRKISNKIEDDE
jgi:hypothetical protein